MNLSDYSNKKISVSPSSSYKVNLVKSRVRDILYEKIPSEHIAKLVSKGRNIARVELSVLIEQIFMDKEFSKVSDEDRKEISTEILDLILGLGPIENLLNDDSVTEIMVNGYKHVFYEKNGVIYSSKQHYESDEQLRLVVDRIVAPLGRRIDEQSPIVNARLSEGHRVNAVIAPVSIDGTSLTIRKFRQNAFSLQDMVDMKSMTSQIALLLSWAVRARKNIAVSGGTGGGKTTLLNALSQQIPFNERIITIEDSAELKFDRHPHVVRMEAREANSEGNGQISIRDLVVNSLRMRPDRIVVGECRGAEAADMLQAMNTGHDGSLTTLHANSPSEVITRLVMMVRYGMDLPINVIEAQIFSALDLIVQQDRLGSGKRAITKIVAKNLDSKDYECVCELDKKTNEYIWEVCPDWVDFLPYSKIATEKEVALWKSSLQFC
ncbi:MAG: CpaF family protein [Coriobacteriales bacterium]|nr:CpaF family protein [Coriobacteriales bacterium]